MHVFGDGATEPVQPDLYSAWLATCCDADKLDIRQAEPAWPTAEPLLRRAMSRGSPFGIENKHCRDQSSGGSDERNRRQDCPAGGGQLKEKTPPPQMQRRHRHLTTAQPISTIRRTGRLETSSMPVSSSARAARQMLGAAEARLAPDGYDGWFRSELDRFIPGRRMPPNVHRHFPGNRRDHICHRLLALATSQCRSTA